jgi:hypothetical protein
MLPANIMAAQDEKSIQAVEDNFDAEDNLKDNQWDFEYTEDTSEAAIVGEAVEKREKCEVFFHRRWHF